MRESESGGTRSGRTEWASTTKTIPTVCANLCVSVTYYRCKPDETRLDVAKARTLEVYGVAVVCGKRLLWTVRSWYFFKPSAASSPILTSSTGPMFVI